MDLLCLIAILVVNVNAAHAEDIPCKTPIGSNGQCVSLQRCMNLNALTVLSRELRADVANYSKQAECSLTGSLKGVCCQAEQVFELPVNCGVSYKDRIAYGNDTAVFEFPWMALLMYRDQSRNTLQGNCDGSVISDRYVLTAAHCIEIEKRYTLEYVRLGEHTISNETDCNTYTDLDGNEEMDCAESVENIRIEFTIVHPRYNDTPFSNDIALIRLAERVVFKDHIKPICLPMSAELKDIAFPDYTVAGWGATEKASKSDKLLQARVARLEIPECQRRIEDLLRLSGSRINITVSEKQICAGGIDRVDSCRGDSGGPLMREVRYNDMTRVVQFGMVSFGVRECGRFSFPGVYVRVGSYLGWILANMKA